MRLTMALLAYTGVFLWAHTLRGDTTPADREAVRVLQVKRDLLIQKINNSPEVKEAQALAKQADDAQSALAKKCATTEVLELDPSKAETYLHCVAKPQPEKK